MSANDQGMVIDPAGWASDVTRIDSPNFDDRPAGMPIELIVLHNISLPPGRFGSGDIAAFFTNRLDPSRHPFFETIHQAQVSAHFLVARDGAIVQFVSCHARAWHAGASDFFGQTRCNDFSIGIEIEGCDDQPFEAAQYSAVATLLTALRQAYPIRAIAGHSDIAPGRKTDPGPCFDWDRLMQVSELGAEWFPYCRQGT